MKLSIKQRIEVLNIIPKVGNVTTLRQIEKLITNAGITDEEHTKYNIVAREDGGFSWTVPAGTTDEKEIEIGSVCKGLMKDALKELNDNNSLTLDQLPLYDLFWVKKMKKSKNGTHPELVK